MENNYLPDSLTINEFLLQMSDDVIYSNIEEQIKDCRITSENYFAFIIDKLEGLKLILNSETDAELINRIDLFKNEVCDKVQELLQNKYSFMCDFKCYSDRSKCLKEIYKFFVIREKEILLNLVNNYIEKEYKSLSIRYSKNKPNKNDITYKNKKKSTDKEDLSIYMNIDKIITSIEIYSIEDLLDFLIDDKEEFTYNFILTMYQQEEILFDRDFIDTMLQEIKKHKNYLIMESRIKLINKSVLDGYNSWNNNKNFINE